MLEKPWWTVAALLCMSALSGCALPNASVVTRADAAYLPVKSEPTALVVARNASGRDRQLVPDLVAEMTARGFQIVDPAHARWILGFGGGRSPVFTGANVVSSRAPAVDPPVSTLDVVAGKEDVQDVYLAAFSGPGYESGVSTPIWEGLISIKGSAAMQAPRATLGVLLDHYGRDYSDSGYALKDHDVPR